MIKNCDLTQKLAYGKTKRIADIYGLSVFLRGGRYGTTHIYQQRVTVRAPSIILNTPKTLTLKLSEPKITPDFVIPAPFFQQILGFSGV